MKANHKLRWKGGELTLERCRVMGVVNVTPDSFSDGGKFAEPKAAVAQAWKLAEEGADILDIGAESTRPGAQAVSVEEEAERLWPILKTLRKKNYPLPISLDSSKPEIVDRALREGWAQIVNDVEGVRDPRMTEVIQGHKAPVILMHMFGTARTMQQDFHYEDVVDDLLHFFRVRMAETGLTKNIVIDPGIGFGKSVQHNLQILHRLREFEVLGCPILIGASRKSFIGKVLDLDVDDRLEGSLAAAAVAAYNGASILRVHDVKETVRVVRLVEAVSAAREINAA